MLNLVLRGAVNWFCVMSRQEMLWNPEIKPRSFSRAVAFSDIALRR